MAQKYTYDDFLKIIEMLRSENGCPWDREQTHESLKPCVMEEAAELVASIRIYDKTGDAENMQEELGDLLLLVALHSQIAKEEGLFTMEDVVQMIAEKMVRRHPHVFGTTEVADSQEVLSNWDEIKKKEKEGKTWIESPLKEIPKELPSLTRATKIQKKVDKVYGVKKDYTQDLEQLRNALENMRQLSPVVYDKDLEKALGDILVAVADISYKYKLSPEQILTDRIEEIIEQYDEKD